MVKAVLFDLFETLVSHLDPDWAPPEKTRAQRLGIDQQVFGQEWPRLEKDWERGVLPSYGEALRELCVAAKVEPDRQEIAELERRYVAYLARTAYRAPLQEVTWMLSQLRASGLRLGVVTNANNLDTAPWDDFGLAKYFDVFVASHRVGALKPEAAIYRIACDRLGVEPNEAAFVGDGGSDELRGAQEVGAKPLWFTWLLDRWPREVRPNRFVGDGWRQPTFEGTPPFKRVPSPAALVAESLSWVEAP